MKKIFVLIATVLLLIGCGNKRGELVGVKQKKWFPEKPFGMTKVDGGAYIMGKADDDMAQLQNGCGRIRPRRVQITPRCLHEKYLARLKSIEERLRV